MSKYNYMPRPEKIKRLLAITKLKRHCEVFAKPALMRRGAVFRLKQSKLFAYLTEQGICPNPKDLERLGPIILDILDREYQELALNVINNEVGSEVSHEN